MKHIPCIALVGISGYARVYLRYLEAAMARGDVHFAAAAVINRHEEHEACARLESMGVALYDNYEHMFHECRGKLDLCLVPVPIHLHDRIAIAAMEAGANVLVEKPLSASVAQVKTIQETEKRTGKWVAVGYQDYYCASNRHIRSNLDSGRLGRVRSIRWLGLWPRSQAYYERNCWSGKRSIDSMPVFDSPLNNAMAHFLNLSLYWAGSAPLQAGYPQTVAANLFRCFPIESFDTAVMRVRTDSQVVIHAAVTHCCPSAQPIQMQILGDKGKLTWTHKRDATWIDQQGKKELFRLETSDEAVDAMFASVLSRLHSPKAEVCTTDLALSHVACIEALRDTPIHTISPENLDSSSTGFAIREIEQDLRNCLRHEALPSELGLKWAEPPVQLTPLVSP